MCRLARRASGTVVSSGGNEYVSSGASALGTCWQRRLPGYLRSGGTASGTAVLNGGTEYVSAGGTASGGTVSAGGNDNVFGSAVSATLQRRQSGRQRRGDRDDHQQRGGVQFVQTGATASGTTVNSGSTEYVSPWCEQASGTKVTNAGFQVIQSGVARRAARLSLAAALNTCRRVV